MRAGASPETPKTGIACSEAGSMPTPNRFTEALRWVDEPQREAAERARAKAADLLAAHAQRHGEGPPTTREARQSLVAITQAAPWTEPAWTAALWLGFDRPGG